MLDKTGLGAYGVYFASRPTMISQSPELAAVAKRWLHAQEQKDHETLVGLFSGSEHLRYIGTGFDEFWAGEIVRTVYADHSSEIPPFKMQTEHIEGFENGPFGWVNWHGSLHFDHIDEPRPLRVTFVFTLENGSWKIVSAHLSTPRLNFEIAEFEHSAFRDLLEAAKHDLPEFGDQDTATIMFTDIVGSTSMNDQLGDAVWARTIGQHLQSVQTLVEANGGTVVKSLGDGTMSSFTSARQSVLAAIAIQKSIAAEETTPRLQVRIGIHTGDVIRAGDDFIGTVVNKAARITEAATAAQILVSSATSAMLKRDEFEFGEAISLNIRGIGGTSTISPLRW